jgi:hypothetical protein
MKSDPKLPAPLRKLRAYKSLTEADMKRALKRAQKDIQAQIALAASKASAATSAQERSALFAEIEDRYKALADGIGAHIKSLVGRAGRAGHDAAVGDLGDKARLVRYDPERTERYFRMIHPQNAGSIAAVFTDKMSELAVSSLRTAVVDVFRMGAAEGMSANEMQKALRDKWDALAGDGDNFRFVDRSGRRWEGARYLQMLVETTAQRVAIESSIDTFAQNGITLMQIAEDGSEDCAICAAWEGRIIQTAGKSKKFPTYEEARAAGMFHPNCTHRPLPVDELIDEDEINRQSGIGKPDSDQMADSDFMQAQKDTIDEARYENGGMSPEDARRAVTADRLEKSIRVGVFSDEAAEAARLIAPEDLDAIRERGVPRFEQARTGDTIGAPRSGRIITPRDPTADDIINLLGVRREGDEQKPPPVQKEKTSPPPFPDDPENLKIVKPLGGSTGAELVEDEHGQRFVRKRGGEAGGEAAEHIRSEAAADEAYSALGVAVPRCRLYERAGTAPVKLSKYIPDATSLGEYLRTASDEDRRRVVAEIGKDFDIDALFGNRDVVGMAQDNILVDANGKPWRIDNGSAFGWRAQGARKNDWTKWPDELNTMRDPSANHGVFASVGLADAVIRGADRDYSPVIDLVPQRDRSVFRERLDEMRQLGIRAKGFRDNGYTEEYNDRVAGHSYALSKEGFREAVPKAVKPGEFGNFRTAERPPTTPDGGPGGMPSDWKEKIVAAAKSVNYHAGDKSMPNEDTLAAASALKPALATLAKGGDDGADYWLSALEGVGKAAKTPGETVALIDQKVQIADEAKSPEYKSLTDHAHDYIKRMGGDVSLVTDWQYGQAGNSWDEEALLRKIVQEYVRPIDGTWITDISARRKDYDEVKNKFSHNKDFAQKSIETMTAYDAAIQLALENCRFDHSNGDKRAVTLLRTEADSVFNENGITEKDNGKLVDFPRGACESHSVFKATVIQKRNNGTLVCVPFPLVKGLYFFERTAGSRTGCFAGDSENEFTCDARKCPTTPIGKVHAGQEIDLTVYREFEKLVNGN